MLIGDDSYTLITIHVERRTVGRDADVFNHVRLRLCCRVGLVRYPYSPDSRVVHGLGRPVGWVGSDWVEYDKTTIFFDDYTA